MNPLAWFTGSLNRVSAFKALALHRPRPCRPWIIKNQEELHVKLIFSHVHPFWTVIGSLSCPLVSPAPLRSVILATICIPVALGLVSAGAHWYNVPGMQSEVRLGRSVFPQLPHWLAGRWSFFFPYRILLKLAQRVHSKYTIRPTLSLPWMFFFFFSWFLLFYSRPNRFGYLAFVRFWPSNVERKTALQQAQFTDSINYASKNIPGTLVIMRREQRVLWI